MIDDPADAWITGQLALTLLAVDPQGLGGLHLRARAGPVRQAFLQTLPAPLSNARRIAPTISDTQLFGGIDIAATLSEGRVIRAQGLLARGMPLLLTMAERCPAGLAARLSQALDAGSGQALILLDEGAEPDERPPETLTERVAFSLSLDGLRAVDLCDIALDATDIAAARERLPRISLGDDAIGSLTVAAASFGIDSLRAPLLALRAARAHAALEQRADVNDSDLQIAAQLVFAHRATMLPAPPEDDSPPPKPEETDHAPPQDQSDDDTPLDLPQDMMIEAVRALLPPELLAALSKPRTAPSAKGSGGAGQKLKGNRRGRPLPSRPGKPNGSNRIDIIATLRAAAPWQPIRRQAQPDAPGLLIRPGDIHIRQYQDLSDRLIIFAVDASGSAAMARLAEAKGAIELMLAEAYARRDHVALVAFRGQDAQVVLPPTRSLVQTKRRLAGMTGGGGTPLAAGLKAAAELARHAMGQGLSPAIAVLTDGRANVPLPGRTGRAAAAEDARAMARAVGALGLPGAVLDTSVRPHGDLATLAHEMRADYIPLPRADAQGLSRAITSAIGA